jgi:hypothetical protein
MDPTPPAPPAETVSPQISPVDAPPTDAPPADAPPTETSPPADAPPATPEGDDSMHADVEEIIVITEEDLGDVPVGDEGIE